MKCFRVPPPARARSARLELETFKSPEVKQAALGMGYMKSELPRLARAAHLREERWDFREIPGHGVVHDLQISPDGRTATITQTMSADLAAPGSTMHEKISFGQVTFSQRLVIDLAPEIPTVVDFQMSQTIA